MSADPRMDALLARLMALQPEQLDALLPAPTVPTTPTTTTVTGQVGAPQLQLLPPTPVTANVAQIISPPGVRNMNFAPQGMAGIPPPVNAAPPPPPSTPVPNPYVVGSLKHLAFSLPEVTQAELLPYYVFHEGDFSLGAAREKLANLANVQSCQTFATIRSSDSRIKIVHSVAKYMAPFGMETGDVNHDGYFIFKGDRSSRCDPPVVKLSVGMLQEFKAQVRTEQEIREHYAQDGASGIVPIDDTEGDRDTTRMVMIPMKWAAELVDKNATPHAFLSFVEHKTKEWDVDDGEYQTYLVNWAMAACLATNKNNGKSTSQLSSPLLDIDSSNDALEAWTEACLDQTLGSRVSSVAPVLASGTDVAAPVIHVTMPPTP